MTNSVLHNLFLFLLISHQPTIPTLFPYTTLFRSNNDEGRAVLSPTFSTILHSRFTSRYLLDDNDRSEEHTSELQSHHEIVCRRLLEKKKAMRAGLHLRVY